MSHRPVVAVHGDPTLQVHDPATGPQHRGRSHQTATVNGTQVAHRNLDRCADSPLVQYRHGGPPHGRVDQGEHHAAVDHPIRVEVAVVDVQRGHGLAVQQVHRVPVRGPPGGAHGENGRRRRVGALDPSELPLHLDRRGPLALGAQPLEELALESVEDDEFEQSFLRRQLHEYTKTAPPHVKAARKMPEGFAQRGDWIEYVITLHGPEPVSEQVSAIDYQHYVDKQLAPVADSIIHFKGTSFDQIINKQLGLFTRLE